MTLPFLKKKTYTQSFIGAKLCSHFFLRVIKLWEVNDARFCLLSHNLIHLSQPLDVAMFIPLKES